MLRTLVRFSFCFFWLPLAVAQEGYQQPPAALAAIVDAPLAPELTLSPSRDRALLLARSPAPTIAELAAPELRLAGVRFNPSSLTSNRATDYTQLTFKLLADGREFPVTGFPARARFSHVAWSPDGRHLSVVVFVGENPGALWIVDVATAQARALTSPQLNGVLGNPVDWLDRDTLLVKMIPRDHGAPPARTLETLGPITQQSTGKRAAARTYTDLLNGPQDETEFEYYGTAELLRVGLDGSTHPLGLRGLLEASPSPDGRFMLVTSLHRPFSYALPASRFPQRIEVYSRDGQLVHTLAALPLADSISIDFNSVRRGPREVTWRNDAPATLAWFEARDGGDATSDAKVRDELLLLAAPFTDAPQSLMKLALRAGSMIWGDDQRMLVTESWRRTRRTRTWLLNPAQPGTEPRLVFERSSENLYEHPGDPVLERGPLGRPQLRFTADGIGIFLRGTGASPEGNRPFLDRLDLTTLKSARLWQSAAPHYEEFIAFLDVSGQRTLTRRESITDAPNYFVRDLARATSEAFTAFANPFPQFVGVQKELISYARADGVTLTGTLYLPPGWKPADGPLPTLLWAYPREFKSADAASQVRDSPHRFVRVSASGPLPYLLLGYAVLDDPAMPIIGEGKREPNDTYVTQLVSSARAAIEELTRRGVTDPQRVAVGGHSYGAFMTANLLAHSDLFRAGIARSGAYNRTLTPFGFQAETRNFWKAPDIYAAMSPFNHADQIKDPLLLIHGQADNNTGTFPLQSERMFQALRGLGATSRYVQLPHESHGYRARESLLHVLWETSTWLDTYVKPPASRDKRK